MSGHYPVNVPPGAERINDRGDYFLPASTYPSGFPAHPEATTGAQREKLGAIPYDLVPFQELTEAYARVAEYGAQKYDAWNWSKGLPRVQLLGSLLRHTFAYLRGEERDSGPKGSGLLHTDHILWNAVTLVHNVHWNLEDGRRAEPERAYKNAQDQTSEDLPRP